MGSDLESSPLGFGVHAGRPVDADPLAAFPLVWMSGKLVLLGTRQVNCLMDGSASMDTDCLHNARALHSAGPCYGLPMTSCDGLLASKGMPRSAAGASKIDCMQRPFQKLVWCKVMAQPAQNLMRGLAGLRMHAMPRCWCIATCIF